MLMRLDMFRSLMKSKSHLAVTASAWREYFIGDCCNLMRVGVNLPIEPIMDHIVNAGDRHLVSRLVCVFGLHLFF